MLVHYAKHINRGELAKEAIKNGRAKSEQRTKTKRELPNHLTNIVKQFRFNLHKPLKVLVGAAGFEPATPSPPDWCANQAAPRSDRISLCPYLLLRSTSYDAVTGAI